jgi:hypothetical protein
MTIDDLKRRIERAWAALEETIDGLSDEQLEAREEGTWAITDHLSHLAAWEMGVAEYLRGRSRAVGMGLREEAWGMDMDEVNDMIYRQNAALSANQARQKFNEAHEQMLDALDDLSDEDLQRDYGELLPQDQESPYTERTVLQVIAGNTYAHYDEHAGYIREKLAA